MNWQNHIVSDPDTLFGKPRIKGTRIGVEFVLDLLASGWTEAMILENYPHLTPEDLQAVFAFVRECLKEETFIMKTALRSEGLTA
ncbi:DUF433 domain-containing protein [Methylomagnum sp.]